MTNSVIKQYRIDNAWFCQVGAQLNTAPQILLMNSLLPNVVHEVGNRRVGSGKTVREYISILGCPIGSVGPYSRHMTTLTRSRRRGPRTLNPISSVRAIDPGIAIVLPLTESVTGYSRGEGHIVTAHTDLARLQQWIRKSTTMLFPKGQRAKLDGERTVSPCLWGFSNRVTDKTPNSRLGCFSLKGVLCVHCCRISLERGIMAIGAKI